PNFAEQFDANVRLLRRLAGQLVETVLAEKSSVFGDDAVVSQAQAWQRDSLLRDLRSAYRREQATDPISGDWIVGTSSELQSR
ncbi:MAG: halogenase, partial [Mycobacterium sp.]